MINMFQFDNELLFMNPIFKSHHFLYRKLQIPFQSPHQNLQNQNSPLQPISVLPSTPMQTTSLLFPILKHTLKQTQSLLKSFTNLKSSFLKSHKNLTPPQMPAFSTTQQLIELLEKINSLSATELSLNKEPKYKSAMPIIKPNTLVNQEQLKLTENLLLQIASLIQVGANQDQPLPTSMQTPNSVLVFLLEQTLFSTKVKFQFHTILTKVDFKSTNVKETVEAAIIESVKTCDTDIRKFLNIWELLSDRDQDYKTYQYIMKLNQDFKSYLMRIVAAFYQLIYNLSQLQPCTFTNFILLSNLLMKSQISRIQLSQKQYQKLLNQQSERKSFWLFSKKSAKQNNLPNQSHQISRSMIKKNKVDDESGNVSHVSMECIQQKGTRKKSVDKRGQNILKNNENTQGTKGNQEEDETSCQQQYLTKDESQVIEFYRNSLLQKMFSLQKDQLGKDFYKQFVLDMLNSYNFIQTNKSTLKSKKTYATNSSIQEILIKVIYRDENMKNITQEGSNAEQKHLIHYSKLLNRCNNILEHIRKHLFPAEYHQKGNFSSFLEFIISLYEKIMIAHKCFVENEMANMMEYDGKNSFSQKAAAVESINIDTQNSFQVLYRINIIIICILADLYDVPEEGFNTEGKLGSFNTLLTLHQVSFNQLNFPSNFSIFEKVTKKEDSKVQSLSTPSYAQYIKSLSYLNTLLLKAHQNTYRGLELCMVRQNEAPKPKQKMVKVESIASQQKKSQQYEEHEGFVLSYQNIIVESLDEISGELEDCFFQYFDKNRDYLMDPEFERFTYFKQISQNILNYVSCLMMIIYRKNYGLNENKKDVIPLKNNVMTSLKLVKVLQRIMVLFWQQFWDFDTWFDKNRNEAQDKEHMLVYVQENLTNLLKLLQKFAIPKESEYVDYRYLKSALIMAPLLECYQVRIRHVSRNPYLLGHLQKSKPFMKTLFQMNQRLSLPELMKTQVSNNLQTRSKLNEQVLQKIIEIFSLDPKKKLSSQVLNHHFALLIEMLFDNFSRMKEKFQDANLDCIGQERFAIHMIGKLLRQINKSILSVQKSPKSFCFLEEKEVQKITVILEMYLTAENYNIEIQEAEETQAILVMISQIQSGAEKVLYEMVNYLVFSTLFKGKTYLEIVKMVMESKFLATGYLVFLRENIVNVKEIIAKEENKNKLFIEQYIQLCVGIYTKIMSFFTLDYKRNDNSEETVEIIILASSIFHELLHFPQFTQLTNMNQFLSLQRIRKSLSFNRIFNTFQLEVAMIDYLCQNKEAIKNYLDMVLEMLQSLYNEIGELEEKKISRDVENYWFVNKMVTDFTTNSLITNLYLLWGHLSDLVSENSSFDLQDLKPSRFLSLVNSSFIGLSKTYSSSIYDHKNTMSNLTVLQTPTFKPQNPFGSKKQVAIEKKCGKPSNFEIQLTQQMYQQESQLQRNISRGLTLNQTQQAEEESNEPQIDEKTMEEDNQNDSQQRKNLIVSQLQIPQGGQSIIEKNEENRSTGQISQSKVEGSITLADESYFACSKTDAVKLFQQFYVNLFKQMQAMIGQQFQVQIICQQLKQSYQEFDKLIRQVTSMHVNNLERLQLSEAGNMGLVKCHIKTIRGYEQFAQKKGLNKQKRIDDEQSETVQEVIYKVFDLYLLKEELIDDEQIKQILEQFRQQKENREREKDSARESLNTESETSPNLEQKAMECKQNSQKTLLQHLEEIKCQLSEKTTEQQTSLEQRVSRIKQHFESIKEQLVKFILNEYSVASISKGHKRKNSIFFMQEHPESSILTELIEAIHSVLEAICKQDMTQYQMDIFSVIFNELEHVLVQCMDLSQLAKTIKLIFKLNLQVNKKKARN